MAAIDAGADVAYSIVHMIGAEGQIFRPPVKCRGSGPANGCRPRACCIGESPWKKPVPGGITEVSRSTRKRIFGSECTRRDSYSKACLGSRR